MMLLVVPLLIWFWLEPVYGWMMVAKYGQFQTIQQQFMSVLMTNGELTTQDETLMNKELQQYGFDPSQVSFTGSTPFNTFVSRGNFVTLNMGYPMAEATPQYWFWNGVNPASIGLSWTSSQQVSEAP